MFAPKTLGRHQPFKVPQLRNAYQKANLNHGFAFGPDGSFSAVSEFLGQADFRSLANDVTKIRNLQAFVMTIDTGTAPAVGYSTTIGPANADDPAAASAWSLLEEQAAATNVDLIAKGTIDGDIHGLLYRPGSGDYLADKTGLGPFTRSQLRARIAAGDTLTLMGVFPGTGVRMGIDRDLDGRLDGD
jgi:hypothetical protein